MISPPTFSISEAIFQAVRRCGALERHMLEQVGDAVLVLALVAGTGFDPDAERDGFDVGKGFGGDCQAVRQTAYLNTHVGLTP